MSEPSECDCGTCYPEENYCGCEHGSLRPPPLCCDHPGCGCGAVTHPADWEICESCPAGVALLKDAAYAQAREDAAKCAEDDADNNEKMAKHLGTSDHIAVRADVRTGRRIANKVRALRPGGGE